MTKTIAILNGKGGVGKTTTTMNLGSALWLLGKRVLLIDADPQCNLSLLMDETSLQPDVKNLYNWMEDEPCPLEEVPIYERYADLNYIPASPMMEVLNSRLRERIGGEKFMRRRLQPIKDSGAYDYILIDCAPNVNSMLNINMLVASDAVLVPTRADYFGIQGQQALLKTVTEVRQSENIELPILGFLLTQYENTRAAKEIQDGLRQMGTDVFPIKIRKCVACTGAQPRQMSLFEFAPDSTAADDYMMVAENLVGRKRNSSKWGPKQWRALTQPAYEQFLINQQENA